MPTLSWLTRERDVRAADGVAYRLLERDAALSAGAPGIGGNMLIQGDNLEALKSLLPYYRGQVKCIYIDPPYNTRSAFEHYDDNLQHAEWLAMIWPRLVLLRELLSEDGSIWVSIDDNEGHYLKVIMDEVFGRSNFVTTFVWKKSYGGGAKARWFVGLHEFVICYAKNINAFPDMFLPPDPDAATKYYKYKDAKYEQRGPYRLQSLATTSNDERVNLRYPISDPSGNEIWPEKQWQWSRDRALAALNNDELVFATRAGKTTVSYKQYLRDEAGEERRRKPVTIIEGSYTQHGTYESVALFGQSDKFAFPKPESLIQTILEASTEAGDLVLDSFLGSGTTAAVAHKMGRRWIGVEMGDHAVTHCAPRLAKVIAGEGGGISAAVGWRGGGGFDFYRLGAPVFDADGAIAAGIAFAPLAAHLWFAETGSPFLPRRRRGTAAEGGGGGGASQAVPPVESPLHQPAAGPPPPSGEEWRGPFLGHHDGRGLALLYNGVLGDRRPAGGNVLTRATLAVIRAGAGGFDGPITVYGEATRLGVAALASERVTFKQTPYDVRGR